MQYVQVLSGRSPASASTRTFGQITDAPADVTIAALGVDHEREAPDITRHQHDGNHVEFISGLTSGGLAGRPELVDLMARAPDMAAICALLQDIVKTAPAKLATMFRVPESSLADLPDQVRDMLSAAGRLLDIGEALPPPDLVIASDMAGLIAGVIARTRDGAALFYDSQEDVSAREEVPEPVRTFWQGVERALVQHADGCLAASKPLAARLSERFARPVTPLAAGWPRDMIATSTKPAGTAPEKRQRDSRSAGALLKAMPDALVPEPLIALEAFVSRHRMIEIRPLLANGVSTIRWNPETGRVDEVPPEFAQMSGGRVGLSVHLPYTTDLNCMYVALEDHDPSATFEIESQGPGGSSAPRKVTFSRRGELFLPWTGNRSSRIFLRMSPGQTGALPQVRAFRAFTLCVSVG